MVRSKLLVSFLLITTVAIGFGNVAWITLKAELAQLLIEQAWAKTLQTGAQVKPWQWADTWPVGRMVHPNSNTDLFILEGAQGNALAFGPGRHVNTGELGSESSVIGGHKDTHFAFLAEANVVVILSVNISFPVYIVVFLNILSHFLYKFLFKL